MITLTNVTKTYQMGTNTVRALRGVSLTIEQGEFVALVGASGSGKSTLLHLLGLLDTPDSGSMKIGGKDVSLLTSDELATLRSETVGFVFQQFHLLKRLTAFDNVELPLSYAKHARPSAEPSDLLGRVGLSNRSHHRPNQLSGGQQQRVGIARALVRRPRILLADEPTGNLDSRSGAEILALLRELHDEGLTIVLVTHELSIAAAADRTIRIHDGEVVEDSRHPVAEVAHENHAILAGPEMEMSRKLQWDLLKLNFLQAGRGLWSNKLRTCLSALGIIIGVAAVIVMMALGNSAQSAIAREVAALGANRIMILPNPQDVGGVRLKAGGVTRITMDDARTLERVSTVAAISPVVFGMVQAVYGHNNVNTHLNGEMPSYPQIYQAPVAYGRFFTDKECSDRARVAVLGPTALTGLFENADPIGKTIEINHIPFTVIGVLTPKGSNGSLDMDDFILIPLQTAMYRVYGKQYIDFIDVGASSSSTLDSTVQEIQELTNHWPQIPGVTSNSYRVFSMIAEAQAMGAVTNTLSVLLASVAAISLVVGGIGIMNIMLVSVKERTREIGLRKALGARGRDIKAQFLTEAVLLCSVGGLIGIGTGCLGVVVVGYFQGIPLPPTVSSIALSCGFSMAIGIGFGYWPAVLAARLDPIEALRYE